MPTATALVQAPPQLLQRPLTPASALDALLASDDLDARQGTAARAYRDLRVRYEAGLRAARSTRNGGSTVLPEAEWFALKRRHGAMLDAAGFDRFLLDRLLLDDDAPLRCEVGRVREALSRIVCSISTRSFTC